MLNNWQAVDFDLDRALFRRVPLPEMRRKRACLFFTALRRASVAITVSSQLLNGDSRDTLQPTPVLGDCLLHQQLSHTVHCASF